MDIQLNFINDSDDVNNSDVVVFAPSHTGPGDLPVAWLVIQNCGRGDHHPFVYPVTSGVVAADSSGNYSPELPASGGEAFAMVRDPSGDVLKATGRSNFFPHIEVANQLPNGTIDAYLCKDGQPCLAKMGLSPGESVVFEPPAQLWFLVASQVQQGKLINSAVVEARPPFEVTLAGIASADIVMRGGGDGPDAKPFSFTLQNVVQA
ncbi:MAG TPA: hypothetical protein VN694_01190 [Caulobacteraceae bacterium]|nr:hypothetical protein [Caulobacteraceae bacterium]